MGLLSSSTAIAIKTQSGAGAFTQPSSSADAYPCANARMQSDTVTAENPEYLGTIHRPGEIVLGERVSLTFSTLLRGPGGASPPSAGAHIPGRLLTGAGFTEVVNAAAIPVAPEAIGGSPSPTTTALALGSTAVGTLDLYKGFPLILSDNGTGYLKQLTAIRSYSAAKLATLFETLGLAPAANYQIPKFLGYQLSNSAPGTYQSASIWFGAVRYDIVDLIPTGLKFNFPTAGRDANEFPAIEWTCEGTVQAWADEAAPLVTALGNPPPFRDGDLWINNLALGGSSFSVDCGITAGYPPNPNKAAGYEAGQIVETKRSGTLNLNHNLKSVVDFRALATAQTLMGLWAQYGYPAAGSAVMFNVPNFRIKFPNPDNGGQFVTQGIDMLIDDASKAINLIFPY